MATPVSNFARSNLTGYSGGTPTTTQWIGITGHAGRFPSTYPYPVTICPAGEAPTPANAEIVTVTSKSGVDWLFVTRAQEGTTARAVEVGDQVFAGITKAMWDALVVDGDAAGGHLGGTYPNPTVQKWNGVQISGTPTAGQVPTATSGTTASWQSAGGGIGFERIAAVANWTSPLSDAVGADGDWRLQVDNTSAGGFAGTELWGEKGITTPGAWEDGDGTDGTQGPVVLPYQQNRPITGKFSGFATLQGRAHAMAPTMIVAFNQWATPSASPPPAGDVYMSPWNANEGVASTTGSTSSGSGMKATSTARSFAAAWNVKGSLFASPTPISQSGVAVITTLPTEASGVAGPGLIALATRFGGPPLLGGYCALVTNTGRLVLASVDNLTAPVTIQQSDTGQVAAGDRVSIERRGWNIEVSLYNSSRVRKTFNISGVAREVMGYTLRSQIESDYVSGYGPGCGVYFYGTTVAVLNNFYGAA